MKRLCKLTATILILSAIFFSAFNADAAEISHRNRQKQFKNTSDIRFKNSSELLNLPESYSSKDLGYCTSVKSQVGDVCWSFSSISSFETAMLKNGLFSSDLSSDALEIWGSTRENGEGWIRTVKQTGSTLIPIGYFTSRSGPVENNNDDIKIASNAISYYDKGDDNLIKLAIMRTGAVTANFISYSFAYSKNYNAHCLTDPISGGTGHSVSVVGWDDNYSKDNFDGNYTPKNDGAWLCKNSWGPLYNSNGGYIWISYEDYYLFNAEYFDPSYAIENVEKIRENDYLYQNEEFGATYSFSYIDEKDITYFNVFDFSENGNVLDKVIFETTSLGAKYSIYYTPTDENGVPINDKIKWKFLKKGIVDYNGYICTDIDDITLAQKKGAIAVEINTDVTKYNVDNNLGVSEWLRDADTKKMRFMDTCKSGKSFVTFNDAIVDVRDFYKEVLDDDIGGTLV
ncbi:MAG: hypothetical protein J1E41_04050, partial [Ruminococcus sp.]|nr:hypothetical protein [Ruminococcus sp.]